MSMPTVLEFAALVIALVDELIAHGKEPARLGRRARVPRPAVGRDPMTRALILWQIADLLRVRRYQILWWAVQEPETYGGYLP